MLTGISVGGFSGEVPGRQAFIELARKAEALGFDSVQVGDHIQWHAPILESTALMRRIEADLGANRYVNALRRRDVTLDALDTSHLLLGGEVHVQQDTTPAVSTKLQTEINDAMKGNLPPAWSEALKEYYKKLSEQ